MHFRLPREGGAATYIQGCEGQGPLLCPGGAWHSVWLSSQPRAVRVYLVQIRCVRMAGKRVQKRAPVVEIRQKASFRSR